MKLSILIPTYNSSNFIQETIYYTVTQLKKINVSSEIIVVDDFSTDNTYAKLNYIKKKFQSRKIDIKIFFNDKNLGQYKNTILALKKSVGEFIVTIDDDCSFSNDLIIKLFESIKDKKNDIIFGIVPKKSLFDRFGRKLISTQNKDNFLQSSSYRIFTKKIKKSILNKSSKYNNWHLLIFNNFKNISNINIHIQANSEPRISNYSFYDKVEILFFVLEKNLTNYFSNILLLILTFLLSILAYSFYRLYVYYSFSQTISPGWTSVMLLGFANIGLNLIILLLVFRIIIKKR
jgi:undecaprenyl-phosphate 4-deoxy-4-formamido-L-arabinose transferase